MGRQSPFVERTTNVTLSIEDEDGEVTHQTGMYTSRRYASCLDATVEYYMYGRDCNIAVNPENNLAYDHDKTKDEMNLTGNPDAYELLGTVIGMREGYEPNEQAAEFADTDLRPSPDRPTID
jgi:hypothetical protein